jgi:hypothetical protein
LEKLYALSPGIYPQAHFFNGKPPKPLPTVTLGEPFDGFRYKLVAGVVAQPDW